VLSKIIFQVLVFIRYLILDKLQWCIGNLLLCVEFYHIFFIHFISSCVYFQMHVVQTTPIKLTVQRFLFLCLIWWFKTVKSVLKYNFQLSCLMHLQLKLWLSPCIFRFALLRFREKNYQFLEVPAAAHLRITCRIAMITKTCILRIF
jgi:hypothetical protein